MSSSILAVNPSTEKAEFFPFRAIAEQAGSRFLGLQGVPGGEPLVLFLGAHGSTLALKLSEFSTFNVFQKILKSILAFNPKPQTEREFCVAETEIASICASCGARYEGFSKATPGLPAAVIFSDTNNIFHSVRAGSFSVESVQAELNEKI